MKTKIKCSLFVLTVSLIVLGPDARAQNSSTVTFSEEGAVRIPDVGRARVGYAACGPNGISYITSMIDPNTSADTRLTSVAVDATVVDYHVSTVQGLIRAFVRSVAPDAAGVSVLVDALPNGGDATSSILQGKTQFLVRYNLSGQQQSLYGLSADFSYQRIASQSAKLLRALRIEKNSGKLAVVSLDLEGNVLGTVDMKGEILTAAEVESYIGKLGIEGIESSPPAGKMETAASPIQMQGLDGVVFLVKPGTDNRVYRIDEQGGVNSIHLLTQAGVDPRSVFLDSDLGLTMLTFGPGERDASLLSFNRLTGKESGQLKISGMAPTSSVCRYAGKFYGTRVEKTGATLMVGTQNGLH